MTDKILILVCKNVFGSAMATNNVGTESFSIVEDSLLGIDIAFAYFVKSSKKVRI